MQNCNLKNQERSYREISITIILFSTIKIIKFEIIIMILLEFMLLFIKQMIFCPCPYIRSIKLYPCLSVHPSIHMLCIWCLFNNVSSPRANYLKFIHKVIDHKRKAKFNFRHFNFFLSGVYAPVYFKLEVNASMSYRHILSFL